MENQQTITDQLLKLLVPEEILEFFEVSDVVESKQAIELEFRERKELIPESLIGEDVVLDGFCNPVELQSFPLKGKPTFIKLELRERKELIPESLIGEDVVLDGFCNPVELQSFPLKGKPTFIKLFRRRWKRRGDRKHYANSYDFAQSGTKATHAFGAFLKGAFGYSPDTFQHARHRLMHPRK